MSNAPIIHIDGVTFTYPGADECMLKDVTLTIDRGDFIAIIGSNGSGKSTLCKLLNGLIPHFYVGDYEGAVIVNGLNTTEHKVAELSRHVGYVYQDFENQLVRSTVLDDASFAPLNYGYTDYKERGRRALELVGLQVNPQEFIWQLSGGQKHLLALAGAISLGPDILIIDEPVAQLDPYHAREVYNVLRKLNEQHGKTIIVIEHHTEFIADYCKHIVLMNSGQVAWKKPTRDALIHVEDLMEQHIFPPQVTQAASRMRSHANNSSQPDSDSYPITLLEAEQYYRAIQSLSTSRLTSIPINRAATHGDQSNDHSDSMTPAIVDFSHVHFSYKSLDRTRKRVVNDVSLSFYPGDCVALVGNNGAGKSSLMRLITGIVKPEAGKVVIKGKDTLSTSPEKLAETVTFVYQNPEDMFIEDSIRKDIEFFLKARRVAGYQEKVDHILESFNLTHLQDRDGRMLSGGQQRRASLAIGVAMNPSIILLDEPTANLDIGTRKYIMHMLEELKKHVETVIVATHDMQLVAEWAKRIVVMHEGRIIHDGTRESVFGDQQLLQTAGLVPPQILELSRALNMNPLCYTVNEFVKRAEGLKYDVEVEVEEEVNVNGHCPQAVG